MGQNNIVSLIKNIVADQMAVERTAKQLQLIDKVEDIPVTYELPENESDTSEDTVVDTPPLYYWTPPDLPNVQIQTFTPKDIATPDGLTLVSQNIELSADGGTTVTAVISCNDVVGAAEYEFRLSSG